MVNEFDAAEELLRRRRARETFVEYCRYLYPEEPPAEHHVLLCNALDEAIESGGNLMVFMPPGSAKSSYSSKRFPGYYLGKFPKKNIISASYGEGLASNFGRVVRNTLDTREYQNLFPVQLSEDSRAKGEWETKEGGTYFATGVGGAITGRRADCLTGDTLVLTNKGEKRIDEIDISSESCYILSYEEKPVYRRILATLSRETEETFRIHTSTGRMVEVTDNHRVYTESGYINAGTIAEGSVLLSLVPETLYSDGFRVPEEVKEKYQCILLNLMRWIPLERLRGSISKKVQDLWKTINSKTKQCPVLHGQMQEGCLQRKGRQTKNAKTYNLWFLWGHFQATFSFNKILLNVLQEQSSCFAYDGREQSVLAQRYEPTEVSASFRESISRNTPEDYRAGQWKVCGLLKREKPARSPYKSKSFRQSLEKLSNFVRTLPSKMARRREVETQKDTVVLVERLHKPAKVYDLQVEGTECFFANGILVHNCGIIDDPVKGRENADSETERNKVWEWYLSDFFSRLKPNSIQIIIQTRWSEDDLSGRLLPDDWDGESGAFIGYGGQEWTVICLPAQARENDILGRKEGDWLWPEWFTEDFWTKTKAVQTAQDTRNWYSLYQQVPRPEEGIFFKRDWFKRYELGKHPEISKYGASDFAVTKDGGDFTEHGICGFDTNNDLWFVDWWSGQVSLDEAIDSMLFLVKNHAPLMWASEVGVIRRSAEPFLKKAMQEYDNKKGAYVHMEWLPHIGDKGANCASFKGLSSMGKVHIPNCEWGDELINQLIKFIPNTNYKDDKVDVCGHFGRILNKAFGPVLTVVEAEKKPDSYGLDDGPKNNCKTA